MSIATSGTGPPQLRADAARNRERLLKAAAAVFSARSADRSLERWRGAPESGLETLYHHFLTREALFEAVYGHEVQQLCELADQLKDEAEPVSDPRRGSSSKAVSKLSGL